jgi:hypothetical protein
MTRGALTTFSVTNDVAKYFAIILAAFAPTYPALGPNDAPRDARERDRPAVIFNALIIIALIPLALKGVRYRPLGAASCCAPHPDLRRRRPDRAVHRDQADRHAAGGNAPAGRRREARMARPLRPAVSMVAVFTILTGVLYPILIWATTHDLFAWEAEGASCRTTAACSARG